MEWSIYDARGRRKYLISMERERFLQRALAAKGPTATFCAVLTLCGARLSEVLALTPESIDIDNCTISFETLKRRRRGVFRVIPVSQELIISLDLTHGIKEAQRDTRMIRKRLWPWSRQTAWRRVKNVMKLALIPDFVSKPKSLRHGLGVDAAMKGVIVTLIRDVLGHTDIDTTMIYTTVVGPEARALMERISPFGKEFLWAYIQENAPSNLPNVTERAVPGNCSEGGNY